MVFLGKLALGRQSKIFTYLGLLLISATFPWAFSYAVTPPDESPVKKEINAIITSRQNPYLKQSDFSNRTEDLDALYKLSDYQLLWLAGSNSAKNTHEALDLLADAPNQGLVATDYDTDTLRNKSTTALALPTTSYKELALYDTALSITLLRYLHDLHYGRVNPHGINFNLQLREKKSLDIPALIKDSIALNTVSTLPILTEPKLPQYQKLKSALATYRQLLAKSPAFKLAVNGKLRPGEQHPQIVELSRFLASIGDIAEKDVVASTEKNPKYSPELVKGIKNFQQRHGLGADGTIGPGTVAALNEPLSKRVNQIELAMERLRWLPELDNINRSIVVNIPAFQLWAIDDADGDSPNIMNMRVVVGKALKNQTPILMAQMSFIEFMPYWNVPKNILKDEILPKLTRNPGYLSSQNMEMVSSYANSAKPSPVNKDSIEKLRKGLLRVRQRPGNKNSLGKVKFIFPNKDDVYLHDTPANSLFAKSRRDFSHGCVRVENPKALAEFALKNQGKWNADTVQKAMKNPANQRVVLQQPIPVLFFYTTAFVDQHNNLAFYPDIYGHDDILIEALKKNEDVSDQTIFVSTNAETSTPEISP